MKSVSPSLCAVSRSQMPVKSILKKCLSKGLILFTSPEFHFYLNCPAGVALAIDRGQATTDYPTFSKSAKIEKVLGLAHAHCPRSVLG
ncbi:hypothetical protein [Microcoleus sp. FACHB-672]|uniref:hypothetical protein n=1 Tax=Microcoleus sp. FACHB-672 TaxID=2692825 RepID=UPI0016832D80|nr:hypothetical protein [Microcoleus sp. FACHB-672]